MREISTVLGHLRIKLHVGVMANWYLEMGLLEQLSSKCIHGMAAHIYT